MLGAACSDDDDETEPDVAAADGGDAAGDGDGETGDGEPLRIATFSLIEAQLLDDILEGFRQALTDAGLNVEYEEFNAQGDATLTQTIARGFVDQGFDLLAVLGTPAVIATFQNNPDTPIVAIAMGDPVGAGVAESMEAPGLNVTGSSDYVDPALLLEQIMRVEPRPTSIGTIYDSSNQNLQVWIADLKRALEAYPDVQLEEATIALAADVSAAARSLGGRVDTMMIGPDALVFSALPAVAEVARVEGMPLYLTGGEVTEPGVLATIGPSIQRLGYTAGEQAVRVLRGEAAGTVPFRLPEDTSWIINQETLDALGLVIPDDVLAAATILGPDTP